MQKLIEWTADKILAGVKNEDMSAFTDTLKNRREALVRFYHGSMAGMPERYCLETGEALYLNADPDDPDVFYTLAKKAVNHLTTSLLSADKSTA